jgi:hypothetical protein
VICCGGLSKARLNNLYRNAKNKDLLRGAFKKPASTASSVEAHFLNAPLNRSLFLRQYLYIGAINSYVVEAYIKSPLQQH